MVARVLGVVARCCYAAARVLVVVAMVSWGLLGCARQC